MIFLWAACSCYGFELPDDINEWHCVSENITWLIPDATSEDLGRIVYKNYKHENSLGTLEIILTEGNGTGNLYVPDEVNNSKGVMPSSASYKIIDINGRAAILETREFLPLVLAMRVSDDTIITLESFSLSEKEITELAGEILTQKNF